MTSQKPVVPRTECLDRSMTEKTDDHEMQGSCVQW